jgi:hypothetical protein
MGQNLIEGILEQIDRCREVLTIYESIPVGAFGAAVIKQSIKDAEKAMATGDTVTMIACYKDLKGIE